MRSSGSKLDYTLTAEFKTPSTPCMLAFSAEHRLLVRAYPSILLKEINSSKPAKELYQVPLLYEDVDMSSPTLFQPLTSDLTAFFQYSTSKNHNLWIYDHKAEKTLLTKVTQSPISQMTAFPNHQFVTLHTDYNRIKVESKKDKRISTSYLQVWDKELNLQLKKEIKPTKDFVVTPAGTVITLLSPPERISDPNNDACVLAIHNSELNETATIPLDFRVFKMMALNNYSIVTHNGRHESDGGALTVFDINHKKVISTFQCNTFRAITPLFTDQHFVTTNWEHSANTKNTVATLTLWEVRDTKLEKLDHVENPTAKFTNRDAGGGYEIVPPLTVASSAQGQAAIAYLDNVRVIQFQKITDYIGIQKSLFNLLRDELPRLLNLNSGTVDNMVFSYLFNQAFLAQESTAITHDANRAQLMIQNKQRTDEAPSSTAEIQAPAHAPTAVATQTPATVVIQTPALTQTAVATQALTLTAAAAQAPTTVATKAAAHTPTAAATPAHNPIAAATPAPAHDPKTAAIEPDIHNKIQIIQYDKNKPQFTKNDLLKRLLEIENDSFEAGIAYSKATFENILEDKTNFLLLAVNAAQQILGYRIYQKKNNTLTGIGIAVDEKARGARIGEKLIKATWQFEEKAIADTMTFPCRPLNEAFFKKLGFRATDKPITNYYISQRTAGIQMQYDPNFHALDEKHKSSGRITRPIKNQQADLDLLIQFATLVKNSTRNGWYGDVFFSLFRSNRKEKAFAIIIDELISLKRYNAIGNKAIGIEQVLRAIIHNALVVRGNDVNSETTSGLAAMNLLNQKEFVTLKEKFFIPTQANQKLVRYIDLQQFANLSESEKQSSLTRSPFSPYCHFAK